MIKELLELLKDIAKLTAYSIAVGVVVMFVAFHGLFDSSIIYLKSGGDFTSYCKLSNNSDYDRAVNLRNIATIRKVEDKRLIVDGNLIILFDSAEQREKFCERMK